MCLNIIIEYNEGSSCLSLNIVSITNMHLLRSVQLHRVLQVYLVKEKMEKSSKHTIDLIMEDDKDHLKVGRKLKFYVTLNQITNSHFKVSCYWTMKLFLIHTWSSFLSLKQVYLVQNVHREKYNLKKEENTCWSKPKSEWHLFGHSIHRLYIHEGEWNVNKEGIKLLCLLQRNQSTYLKQTLVVSTLFISFQFEM